ncbi:hypothetical protein [Granulicella arctica]|uniref:hypothetical protein n=1 Tax=Granulicella arctica TaxID=940613 RepID=UPI0021E02A10|nr:hypothetical protein [Granulicella arctica]
MSSTAEYDLIQAQIRQLKAELAATGLPEELRRLREQIRPYPYWETNFGWPMHPLVSGIATDDDGVTHFTFSNVKYTMTFIREADYGNTIERSTPIKGKLLVEADGVLVLDSRFYGESDEYSDKWRYHDSDIYKKGPWVHSLLRFKKESNQLIEAARAQSQLLNKQDPAVLQAMRDKFNLPTVTPPSGAAETKTSSNSTPMISRVIGAIREATKGWLRSSKGS